MFKWRIVPLLLITKKQAPKKKSTLVRKKVYYISAEFLIGKLLSNNLINLGLYDDVKKRIAAAGKDLIEVEEVELEPSLGNGGLGRLAACFIDSISSLGLNGDGVGLNYHFGFSNKSLKQPTRNDSKRMVDRPKLVVRSSRSYKVPFAHFTLTSTLYDIDVPGYKTDTKTVCVCSTWIQLIHLLLKMVSTLTRQISLATWPSSCTQMIVTNKVNCSVSSNNTSWFQTVHNWSSTKPSKRKQLAWPCGLCCCTNQRYSPINGDPWIDPSFDWTWYSNGWSHLSSFVAWLLTLTTQSLLKPLKNGLLNSCKKWFLTWLPIIKELDRRVRAEYKDPAVQIIDENDRVHMAHMDIHYGFSVNGVAALHTEILKNSELKAFLRYLPWKNSTTKQTVSLSVVGLCMLTQDLSHYLDDISDVTGTMTHLNWKTFFLMKIKMQSKKNWKHQVSQQT